MDHLVSELWLHFLLRWGITFGTSLPHPTTNPDGRYDGYRIPTINYVNWTLNAAPIDGLISGAYFLMLLPTFPPSEDLLQRIHTYKNDLSQYYAKRLANEVPSYYPTPLGTLTGTGPNGLREVRGMVIQDHTSPTGMSVCDDSFVPPIAERILVFAVKGAYLVKIYGSDATSGDVLRVEASKSSQPVVVTQYQLTYSAVNGGEYYHISGTVKLSNGTILSFDEDILGLEI